jgi:hypothetical protein
MQQLWFGVRSLSLGGHLSHHVAAVGRRRHEEGALVSAIKQYEHLHPNIHVVILTYLTTWTAFIGPLIFINNESQFTLSLGLEQYQSTHFTVYNYLMAVSLIFMIPTLILFVAAQRHLVRGIAFSGLKN